MVSNRMNVVCGFVLLSAMIAVQLEGSRRATTASCVAIFRLQEGERFRLSCFCGRSRRSGSHSGRCSDRGRTCRYTEAGGRSYRLPIANELQKSLAADGLGSM
jgi:hypothetical protein